MKLRLNFPFFIFLLPMFFVLHGFVENYNFVPIGDALFLVLIYIGFASLFGLAAWLFFRDIQKAALVAGFVMAYHFFFGSVHDFLKSITGSFFSTYTFLIGGGFLLLVFLVIFLKRKKHSLPKTSYYLNLLFIVLILVDLGLLAGKMISSKKAAELALPEGMTDCRDCPKPDIYFIIPDEYVGDRTLREKFNFDNSSFIRELANRGFYTIPESRSNYNFTPYSIASTLNMEYLPLKARLKKDQPDLAVCYTTIRNNRFSAFLRYQGYRFFNYSIFDFNGHPAMTEIDFLPVRTKLITAQTFISRFNRDIRFNLITRFKSERELKRHTYGTLKTNNIIFDQTMKTAALKSTEPKFVFTHLHLPHYPYFFDKTGKEQPFEKLVEGNQVNKEMYIEYLQYGNKKYLELIDHIIANSTRPPIIILLGDHGFRHFNGTVEPEHLYLNHVSVLLPGGSNYTGFGQQLTNVNFNRVLLNTVFRQQLPMLRDSTILIKE